MIRDGSLPQKDVARLRPLVTEDAAPQVDLDNAPNQRSSKPALPLIGPRLSLPGPSWI